ncbi:flagellar hook-basal body protein [Thalassoroseus pseudoceratinae]|uniref:flagellar hook-basal body protein n=1 Tax=Thalassoroseus pseudoceratinae TaxID=2713176 RepID=UPI00141DEDCD|nr:flagellar hook basal-body protein [Thalassoroseus pseudoceratinae]
MLYGLYLSAQGAQVQSKRLDVIANNLANADTSGFKRDLAVAQTYHPFDVEHGTAHELPRHLERVTGGTSITDVITDFQNGSLKETGARFDVALEGQGFLRVSDGQNEFLTRDGSLTQNAVGELVTEQGERVLDTTGSPIVIPPDATEISIGADGVISAMDDLGVQTALAQLDVVMPQSLADLQKIGDNHFVTNGPTEAAGPATRVRQGYVEGSGVNAISETVHMIDASKAFETNLNLLKLQDETLSRLLQAVPGR